LFLALLNANKLIHNAAIEIANVISCIFGIWMSIIVLRSLSPSPFGEEAFGLLLLRSLVKQYCCDEIYYCCYKAYYYYDLLHIATSFLCFNYISFPLIYQYINQNYSKKNCRQVSFYTGLTAILFCAKFK